MFDTKTELPVVKEIVRLAEKKLDAQLQIISALAQRAGALASILGAGATAMLGGELAFLNYLHTSISVSSFIGALIAPGLAYVGCVLCGRAAGTSKFQTSGNHPRSWKENVKEADLAEALCGEAENYQQYIDDNDKIIRAHAAYLRWGLRFGAASPIALVLAGLLFQLCG